MTGGGLYLFVTPDQSRPGNAASKLWRMGYRFRTRQKTYSIGPYGNGKDGTFSLPDARRERDKAKDLLKEGKDPSTEKQLDKHRQAAARPFEQWADEWLAKKKVEKVKRGRIVAVRDPKTIEVLKLRVGYVKDRFGKLCRQNAPQAWSDRERLWNDVEAFEVRKDAQLAREVEFALPSEMSEAQGIDLARDFVRGEFVDRGMIADLNLHWDMAEDGMPKPHAHVMLTMRAVDENGFGGKVREWNRTEMLERWRRRWAELANERLAELDVDARIDHRSLEAEGLAPEPQTQNGP